MGERGGGGGGGGGGDYWGWRRGGCLLKMLCIQVNSVQINTHQQDPVEVAEGDTQIIGNG